MRMKGRGVEVVFDHVMRPTSGAIDFSRFQNEKKEKTKLNGQEFFRTVPLMVHKVDWEYEGEGGQHAIFRYIGNDGSLKGKLLRIRKGIGGAVETNEESISLRRQSLHSLLDAYVDIPDIVHVDQHELHRLVDAAKQSGKIPLCRLGDWESKNNDRATINAERSPLLRDYRLPPRSSNLFPSSCHWSVEIKPKAGYTAISPMASSCIPKFFHSRFRLANKSTSSSESKRIAYNPLDLYSGEYERIARALDSLMSDKPSKYFRLWRDRQQLHADQLDPPSKNFYTLCTARVLAEEPFLTRLLDLQKLDIVDGEGAIVIYRHLSKTLGGDELTNNILDCPTPFDATNSRIHSLLANSPIPPPVSGTAGIQSLCDIVDKFRIQHCLPRDFKNAEALRSFREHFVAIVEQNLSVRDCCYLLQLWLLSLSMCDVSFFVTFWSLEAAPLLLPADEHLIAPSMVSIQRLQTKEGCGTLIWNGVSSWNYEIKMIDFDPKQASKLQTRHRKEEQLNNSYTTS